MQAMGWELNIEYTFDALTSNKTNLWLKHILIGVNTNLVHFILVKHTLTKYHNKTLLTTWRCKLWDESLINIEYTFDALSSNKTNLWLKHILANVNVNLVHYKISYIFFILVH